MNILKRYLKRQLRAAFGAHYLLDNDVAAGGGSGGTPSSGTPAPEMKELPAEAPAQNLDDKNQQAQQDNDFESYMGSEKVNPEKRPLKKFDRTGMTEKEIDDLIELEGENMFLPKDKIETKTELEKKDDKKPEETKKEDQDKKVPEADFDGAKFLQTTGLTEEEFAQIPESLQEKLVSNYSKNSAAPVEQSEQYIALKTDFDKQKEEVAAFLEDPYVAARLEEIQTGQKYIAESLPPITNAELKDLQSAQTIEELEEKLNKYIESRAEVAINRERTISDRKAYVKKTMIKASSVLSEVSKLDPRLTGNIKAENWNDIKPGHPDYAEFQKGPKKIVDYCIEKNIKIDAIANMTPKELYAAIAAKEGWDKVRDVNIAKNAEKKFLLKIKELNKQAKTVDTGRRSAAPVSGTASQTGDGSRESLVKQLASGDRGTFDRLLSAADGNPVELDRLESIAREAQEVSRQNRRKG